ncbi:MAG: hypothetical protein ACE5H0_13190, partial [Bacteroidota bacterium]
RKAMLQHIARQSCWKKGYVTHIDSEKFCAANCKSAPNQVHRSTVERSRLDRPLLVANSF